MTRVAPGDNVMRFDQALGRYGPATVIEFGRRNSSIAVRVCMECGALVANAFLEGHDDLHEPAKVA